MNFNQLISTFVDTDTNLKQRVYNAINQAVTIRNWLYGLYIVEFEQNGEDKAVYGEKLIKNLSEMLKKQNLKAVSDRELRNYRRFYFVYPQIWRALTSESNLNTIWRSLTSELNPSSILQSLSAKSENAENQIVLDPITLIQRLSYTHLEELIKIDDSLKRTFYEIECIKGNWSVRELERQTGSLLFERTGLSKNKEKVIELANNKAVQYLPEDIIRNPYIFEFLGLKQYEVLKEAELEETLLNHLQSFILELGKGFCFEARQKRITIDNKHFYIDLVFYHKILKCNVLIELKTRKFEYADAAQMTVYLNYYRKHEVQPDDNEPVGILLCTEKGDTLVEYAVNDKQLFVSKYQFALPSVDELKLFITKELKENF